MFEDFKWLSLDEFYDLIQKSKKNLEKADVDVGAHDRISHGHVVQVRPYKQRRPDPTTPIVGVSGPVKHHNQKPENTPMGGKPEAVPTVPAKNVQCPHCSKTGTTEPQTGQHDTFKYAPPKNPVEGKSHDEISLDDIAQVVHKYPYVYNNSVKNVPEGAKKWKDLSHDEKEKHLMHDPFQHLPTDGKIALKRELQKVAKKKFQLIGEWLQLHRLGTQYDPETLLHDFTDRIIEEMTPFSRAEAQHGYAKYGSPAYKKLVEKYGKDVPTNFHQGMDANQINTGADLIKQARIRIDKWARRFLEKEAGFNQLLDNPDVRAQTRYKGKIYKLQHDIEKLQKKSGIDVGQPKIDTNVSYDLSELENIADKTGYRIEKESKPDGSLQRILIFEDDPENIMSGFVDENKASVPKEVVDLEHGGKLSDVRDKMAGLINPSSTGVEVPLKKFKDLHEKYANEFEKLSHLHKQQKQLQEKIDRESVPPETHYKTLTEYASNAVGAVEDLKSKGVDNDAIHKIAFGVSSVLEYLADGDFNEGFNELKSAKAAVAKAKSEGIKGPALDTITQMLEKMQADAEAYKNKKTMNPQQRKQMLEKLDDQLNDLNGDILDKDKDVAQVSTELEHLKGDPYVSKYMELQDKHNDYKKKLDEINPKAEKFWQVALDKQSADGEDMGNYADDLAMKQYQHSLKHGDEDDTDWDEIVPKDVDLDDEKDMTEAGAKIAEAIGKEPAGRFLFGGMGHKVGLVQIAANLAGKLVQDDRIGGFIGKFLKENPADSKKAPDIYKNYGMLSDPSYHRWKKIHDLYEKHPDVVDEYAVKFSDYYPYALGVSDVYHGLERDEKGNPKQDEKGNYKGGDDDLEDLREAVKDVGRSKDKKKLPTEKVFEWQFYYLLRYLGNHAIEQSVKNNPSQKAIFDKIKELNKPHRGNSSLIQHSPGKLRRKLARRMDVIFGNYSQDVPDKKIFPEWKHDVNDSKSWLGSVLQNDEDEEKALVLLEDKLEKGRLRHVITISDEETDS